MSENEQFFLYDKSAFRHLRLPFSFHLMPVFLFALSQASDVNWGTAILSFIILHLFIYPASNGYNSYQDKDETSIGGLRYPPRVTRNLFYLTLMLDIIGIVSSLLISIPFTTCVIIYMLISRAYSYRGVRLKKYAILGFLTVFFFQGAFTYYIATLGVSERSWEELFSKGDIICMLISSLFIGSVYPLTQIYQHESDKKDGVITLSYKLGYTGTFVFSALLFSLAAILLFYYFNEEKQQPFSLLLFFILMLPVIIRLLYWYKQVRRNTQDANFDNTMTMNVWASACMNIYFLILICNNFLAWF
jgi:1,4-dihydroxy-2-naphthoate octaprenyltransferase